MCIVSIDAIAVIKNKKKGKTSIVCKLWLKKCFSCSKEDKQSLNNCLTPTNCNSNRVKICYNKNAHMKWNIEAGQIIEFIRGGSL